MARTEWHDETWEEIISSVKEHFEGLGFEVHVNRTVRTITIIHRPSSKALTLMDTTMTHFDGDGRLVFIDLWG